MADACGGVETLAGDDLIGFRWWCDHGDDGDVEVGSGHVVDGETREDQVPEDSSGCNAAFCKIKTKTSSLPILSLLPNF